MKRSAECFRQTEFGICGLSRCGSAPRRTEDESVRHSQRERLRRDRTTFPASRSTTHFRAVTRIDISALEVLESRPMGGFPSDAMDHPNACGSRAAVLSRSPVSDANAAATQRVTVESLWSWDENATAVWGGRAKNTLRDSVDQVTFHH
jgi:hypothetical protein